MKHIIALYIYIFAIIYVTFSFWQNIPPKTYITIQFKEARPVKHIMSVYYKGFKIGRTIRMHPSRDYRTTLLTVVLTPQDLKLPVNITAVLNRDKKKTWLERDYIDIIYPSSPSLTYLKDGDIIDGNAVVDLDSFLADQANSGYLDELKDTLKDTAKNANAALESLNGIFIILKDIVDEARPNIIAASQNLADTTKNLYNVSANINTSFNRERLDYVGEDLNGSTRSLNKTIENVEQITDGLKTSVPEMQSIIKNIDNTTCNLNVISYGIAQTLKKRMGLMKLFFGKPINCTR